MYSPKIRDDLIPRIYRAANEAGIPMTKWVNRVVEQALSNPDETGGDERIPSANEEPVNRDPVTPEGGYRP